MIDVDFANMSVVELKEIAKKATDIVKKKQEVEVADLVKKLLDISKSSGISVHDLLEPHTKRNRAKYVNPDDHTQFWTGKGKRPRWLVAKIEQGLPLDDMAIK